MLNAKRLHSEDTKTRSSMQPALQPEFKQLFKNDKHKHHESLENELSFVMDVPEMNLDDHDFEDDFMFPEDEPLIDVPTYDQFICEPPEDDSRLVSTPIKFFTKLFKFISYIVFGGAVFAGGFVSKAALMVLVNSAKPYVPSGTDSSNSEQIRVEHDAIRVWSYIIILIMLLVPEVLTIAYSLYRVIMKPEGWIEIKPLLWGGLWEVLHAFGEAILFLKVFPYLDATVALMIMPMVGLVPISIHIHAKVLSVTHNKHKQYQKTMQQKRIRNLLFAILALILQVIGLVLFFACFFSDNWFEFFKIESTYIWCFFGVILTSMRYWENFVTSDIKLCKLFTIKARKLHDDLDGKRFSSSLIYSFTKCLILTGMTFLILLVVENDTYSSDYVLKYPTNVNPPNTPLSPVRYQQIFNLFSYSGGQVHTRSQIIDQLWYVLVVQVCCAFGAFFFGRVACMTMIQSLGFTFPTMLVTPVISACSAALAVYKQCGGAHGLLGFVGLYQQYRGIKSLTDYVDWNNVLFDGTLGNANSGSVVVSASDVASAQGSAALLVIVGLILGWLGIMLITDFTWENAENRLERMQVLFVKPLYGGPLIDQVLLLNRRQFEGEFRKNQVKREEEQERKKSEKEQNKKSSSRGGSTRRKASRRMTVSRGHKFVPQLFLCATMWHETTDEMTQILTSLMRLDKDQGGRRENSQKDEDFYNFQVHILFDDAMEKTSDGKEIKTNKWVHQLCDLIPLAANKVELGKGYDLPLPVIYPTPYGGRLEFIMPHGNLLVVHLKDKQKIRHRKRWSQCMYMYYILGYLQATKKAYKLEDVFLLALDGDVDFQPAAVLLVLDRMKRNPDVGAACGRIHPTGSGPMVWFQKFEYAVGHWLQKTTEHVLGCVLCSPGCFSLFRGAALVDINVMNQYTAKATEARHYVQWDQGEDRWLCTLLLKRGWRIEYTASSDSFTFAPEEFKEFYNQRRRWGPSTMANIFDILLDAKLAVQNNMYISWGYITYQLGLMISSLLGPATVVMIVQGAYQYVFKWSGTVSLIVSLVPVVIFIILCYTTSADTQVLVAAILTILYALVMMGVLIGVIGALVTKSIFDPNNLFMVMLVGFYAITGFLHPQEMLCLIHGLLYYLCVPSAFIFLMVYSLVNMNNVSWGTREVKSAAPAAAETANQQALQEVASKPAGQNVQIGPSGSIYDGPPSSDGYYSCGLGNLCQCALCIQPKPPVYQPIPTTYVKNTQPSRRFTQTQRRATLANRQSYYKKFSQAKAQQISGVEPEEIEESLNKRMSVAQLRRMSSRMGVDRESITTSKLRRLSTQHRRMSRKSMQHQQIDEEEPPRMMSEEANRLVEELYHDQEFDHNLSDEDYDDAVDPDRMQEEEEEMLYWLIDGSLEDGVIDYLDNDERDFWKYLIEKYLYPLDEDKNEKERIKSDLIDLRNQVTGAYFLFNALWLILNFALQLTITDFSITFWIAGVKLSVNPVSFAFLIFYLIILVVQFFCMLVHRWSTTLHLLSVTSMRWLDGREGIKNVKNSDLEKAIAAQKNKKLKKPAPKNRKPGRSEDFFDLQDNDPLPVKLSELSERSSSSGIKNPAFESVEVELGRCDSSDEEKDCKNTFDKVRKRNPLNKIAKKWNLYRHTTKKYESTGDANNGPCKTATSVDVDILNNVSSQNDLIPRTSTRSVFNKGGVSDQFHEEKNEEKGDAHNVEPEKDLKHHAGVHFNLPSEQQKEDNTSV